MGNRDSVFLVQTQQHLRLHIAQVIDQAVVQTTITGAWVQRDERNS